MGRRRAAARPDDARSQCDELERVFRHILRGGIVHYLTFLHAWSPRVRLGDEEGFGSSLVALFLVPMALAFYAQEKEAA